MPRYTYRCDSCSTIHEVTHSMSERLSECSECNMESLTRIPSSFISQTTSSKQPAGEKPGELVKKFIENTKEEIKTEKNNKTKEMNI